MKCPFCGNADSKVLDSRNSDESNVIRRRRECLGCNKRYTTYEAIETMPILVVKSDGTRQAFDANKLKRGILRACEKRPISMAQIDIVVSDIQKNIQNTLDQEITSKDLGEMVMERLKVLDDVAYVRFASVYRKFADLTHFVSFLEEFKHDINTKVDGTKSE
ncbi:MAG: transcriptional repressor NrdR [Clostridiales bacterium]|nr:transcriptional repressor NrdR [Clostridiales bacterium]